MRIVAGKWGRRSIKVLDGKQVRPTRDMVRESWMNILQPQIPGARVLDLFSGSGALALEALSRGARFADLVENNMDVIKVLQENIKTLGAENDVTLHRADALHYASKLDLYEYDIAFADPPYDSGAATKLAEMWLAKPFSKILSIEHPPHETMPPGTTPGRGRGRGWGRSTRKYGNTAVTFYEQSIE